MMTGRVTSLHILVLVPLRRAGQPDVEIEFVVDTGFTGHLCLPLDLINLIGLPFRYNLRARLADDSAVMSPVHAGVILWHGMEREVNVLVTGRRPLLGTALLDGNELLSQFEENGGVTVTEL